MRVSKSYSRETTEPPREYSYNSDSAEPRATPTETRTQYITCGRAHSEFPEAEASWGPRSLGNLPASSEASVAAAQLAVTELFPELQESYNAPLDQSQARRYYPQQYTTSTGITPPRRFSPATVDPSLTGSISPYRTRSPSHDGRPRSEYPSASPESLHLYGPTARSSPAHRSSSSYTYANTLVEDDYDSEYDETDEDEDLLSAIPIRIESPNRYFESSASPEVEPITPLGSKYSSPEFSTASSHTMHPPRKESSTGSAPRRMRKAGMPAPPPPTNNAPPPTTTIGAADSAQYEENDALLVQYRRMGISYKTIKTRLNLDEAESTLRGRYRTLTKPKNERLRKPVWSEDDVRPPIHPVDFHKLTTPPSQIALLLNIVDPDLPHIKWKQVSDTIVTRGGTYRFGSSTCKKQYLALVGEGRAQPLNEGVSTSKRRKHRSLKNGS